jgi:hypothetical protein
VLLDAEGRPSPIPEDVRGEIVEQASARWIDGVELDAPETPMAAGARAWRRSLEARPSDLDLLRHVNHATYLAYVDDTWRLCAAAGGYGDQPPAGRVPGGEPPPKCGPSARSIQRVWQASIDYQQPAVQGERLAALTWVVATDPLTLAFLFQREADGRGVCRAAVRLGEAVLPPAIFAVG